MAVRVLIVDDQAPFRQVARAVVESTAGFEVAAEAETGENAVRLAGRLKPDLVLMDVNLPDLSGTVAAERILAEDAGTIVLLVSTYEEQDYAPRAIECGAAGYVSKAGLTPDRLRQAWAGTVKAPLTPDGPPESTAPGR